MNSVQTAIFYDDPTFLKFKPVFENKKSLAVSSWVQIDKNSPKLIGNEIIYLSSPRTLALILQASADLSSSLHTCHFIIVIEKWKPWMHPLLSKKRVRKIFLIGKEDKLLQCLHDEIKNEPQGSSGVQQMDQFRKVSQSLEKDQKNLMSVVRQRTKHLQEIRQKAEEQSKLARALQLFLHELIRVQSSEDILTLLFSQVRNHHQILQIAFAWIQPKKKTILEILTDRYKFSILSLSNEPQVGKSIRLNAESDLHWFANAVKAPVNRLVALPLRISVEESEPETLSCLYIHFGSDSKYFTEVIDFFAARAQAIETSLARLMGEQRARVGARIWADTFSGLHFPVVILDEEFRVVRSNSYFKEKLEPIISDENLSELKRKWIEANQPIQISIGALVFEVHLSEIKESYEFAQFHFVGFFYDVTKSIELRQELLQNEKMVALGHLAGNIAHELNNPLTGISSLCEIMQDSVEDSRLKEDLIQVEEASRRCQKIIVDLMEFSKGDLSQIRPTVTSLNELMEKTLGLIKSVISDYRRNIEYLQSDCFIKVDQSLLQQVILNLIQNACQAMGEDEGELSIGLTTEGTYAVIRVKDNGRGIARELQGKIFDAFFTTKSEQAGTGLGLSLSKKVVESFGGRLVLENSEIGKGSTFAIFLPIFRIEDEDFNS